MGKNISSEFGKLYYSTPLHLRNNGDKTYMTIQKCPVKSLFYDLRIDTYVHGWRHIESISHCGCLFQISYLDDEGNEWCFYKKPDSLVAVEIPDDSMPAGERYFEEEWG